MTYSLQVVLEYSAYRHGFTDDDVLYVVNNHLGAYSHANDILYIGFTRDGILLEVIGDFQTKGQGKLFFRCYHCMECTPQNAKLLEK